MKQLIGFGFVTENYREEIDVVIMKSKAKHLTLGLKVSEALRRHSETAIETNRFAIHHRILDQELREVRVLVRVSKTLWENH